MRSIEEPASTPLQLAAGRMSAEQGGTGGYGGYGTSEHSLLIATRHAGVPLPLAQQQPLPAHYQPAPPSTSANGPSSCSQQQQHHQSVYPLPPQQQQYALQQPHHPYQYQYQHHYHHQPTSPHHSRPYDPEHARMEAWLDENQEFVQDYFIR